MIHKHDSKSRATDKDLGNRTPGNVVMVKRGSALAAEQVADISNGGPSSHVHGVCCMYVYPGSKKA